MERYLTALIREDSKSKVILLSGPRQCGKTTLVKNLFQSYSYLNYDLAEDRQAVQSKHWRRDNECVIFDELHKMPEWKRWIKGIYDSEGVTPRIVVTGSVNVESFLKVGDSMAGRYFHLRLHPIDIKEAYKFWQQNSKLAFDRLMSCRGFPEPFIKDSVQFYRRWQRTHIDVIKNACSLWQIWTESLIHRMASR